MDESTANESFPSFLIDRSLVNTYCNSKGFDVYGLLQEAVSEGISSFSSFLSQKGLVLSILGNNAHAILHGSGKVISYFEPRVSKGGPNANQDEPLVYASDDPDYAIFLAIIKLKDEGMAYVGYTGGNIECSINMAFINGESKFSDGFVYLLDRQTFNEDALHNFSSPYSQTPILAIPVNPSDMHTKVVINH